MTPKTFGFLPNGTEVLQYTLKSEVAEVRVLNYGGIITDFIYNGRNIVCGFDTLSDYLIDDSYQGAMIGRYANRIAGAAFMLNGTEYKIGANEGNNSLHGGNIGFNQHVFTVQNATESTLTLSLLSPNGDEGYPGNLNVKIDYTLDGSALTLTYTATTDADTPVSLTNHSYFNLAGIGGSIMDFDACILADRYTEVDDALIPTGNRLPVADTLYDLRTPRKIGEKKDGYDTNFVLNKSSDDLHAPTLAAMVCGGGLTLSVYTTQPCIQFYTGCVLEGEPAFRGGIKKARYTAFCLETQAEPDAPNHGDAILRVGETYKHTTIYHIN